MKKNFNVQVRENSKPLVLAFAQMPSNEEDDYFGSLKKLSHCSTIFVGKQDDSLLDEISGSTDLVL